MNDGLPFAVTGLQAYVSGIIFLLTVAAPTVIIAHDAPRKSRFVLRCVLCAAGLILFSELYTLITDIALKHNPDLIIYILYFLTGKFFLTYVLTGVCVKICFDVDAWGALFCATAGYCMQHIQAKIGSIITEFIIKADLFWVFDTLINITIAAVCYGLFWLLFFGRGKRIIGYTANHVQVAIAACVVGINIFYNSFGIAYISGMAMELAEYGAKSAMQGRLTIFVYIMSGLIAVLALALDIGMSFNKQLKDEKAAVDRILEEGKVQYAREKANMEMLNVKCHDLKHQLAALHGKIYEEQIAELAYTIEIYDGSVMTGNEAIDVVLTQKSLYCANHGIRFTCLLDGTHYDFIPRHELYSMLSNAIDNAIEAALPLPEEMRVISVSENTSSGLLNMRIENYYDGKPKSIGGDGLPQTEKVGSEHGYGMKSIKMLAEKNGGGISVKVGGDTFVLNIFFDR